MGDLDLDAADFGELVVERLLAHPGQEPTRHDRSIRWHDGTITEVADAQVGTGVGLLAMPAIADAHDHGRGVSTLLMGAADAALELWLPALAAQPNGDCYAVNALALARLARSGCSAITHCHVPHRYEAMVEEAGEVARAVREIGIRLGFVVPLRDRNRLVIGDNDAFLARLPEQERIAVQQRWLGPLPSPERQVALIDEVARHHATSQFDVQYGPVAPHWCSDHLLSLIAEASAQSQRRIHMHLLESPYHREWADAAYPHGLIRHLDALGILSPRLSIAHGVWLRPAEIELLAERGVTVVVNSSSNLRLRSGLAPMSQFHKIGVAVAIGLDGMGLDDDSDLLRELRLARLFHAGHGLEEGVSAAQILTSALAIGPHVTGAHGRFGQVAPGFAADLLVLDLAALTDGAVPAALDDTDLVLGRATRSHVKALIVAGRMVVRDGRVTGIDEEALAREVDASARHSAAAWQTLVPTLRRFQDHIRAHYASGQHRRDSVMP